MFCLLLLIGCGYYFRGSALNLPLTKGIFLEVVRNETQEIGIERIFTDAIYREFTGSKAIKMTDRDEADALLETTIIAYSVTPIFFDLAGTAIQYRAVVNVRSVMRDRKGEIIWESGLLSDSEEYFKSTSVIDIKRNEWLAVELIANDIAEEIHDMLLENYR